MTEPNDTELRARFEQLRDDDQTHAPSFRALWAGAELGARRAGRGPAPALLWMAAAAGVVLAVGVALRGPSTPVNVVPTISIWRSPTAGLLRTSGRELLAAPSIRSSILGGVARAPIQRKGDS